jgi:hypothetical protein
LRECQLGWIMAGVSLGRLARTLLEAFHVRLWDDGVVGRRTQNLISLRILMWASREWDSMSSGRSSLISRAVGAYETTGRQQVVCVPGGTTRRLVRSRAAREALSHARNMPASQAFGCDITSFLSARPMPLDCSPAALIGCPAHSRAFLGNRESLVPALWAGILALYALPCAHSLPLGATIRFICTRSTWSSCADMRLTPSSSPSQDAFSQWYARRRLRLAIMPTGSVVCICRPPMRETSLPAQ